ncbi:MAG: DUF2892 domain-containing protein [bacterium]|nr:DUF2892 domain-containing protein [bacterium]
MTCNVGKTDRIFRIVLGITIISAGIYFRSFWGAIGLIPLTTAALRWCPLYLP